jgi:hypothetical protein
MGISTQRQSEPFQCRTPVHLSDTGDEVYPHGLALAPGRIKTADEALAEVDRLFNVAVAEAGDEWSYEDVLAKLQAESWLLINPAYWDEQERDVTYPGAE